jgi:cob(I)alamin adenosyltransferase
MTGFTGKIQLYTGYGKGKTTAAMGLALRAYGTGMRIFFGQFIKSMPYSEHKALEKFSDRLTLKTYGKDCFIHREPQQADQDAALVGFKECQSAITSQSYDLVILDEICLAVYFNLIPESDVLELCQKRPSSVEIVLTGRYATPALLDMADLVTQMKEIKHYFNTEHLEARLGIEK